MELGTRAIRGLAAYAALFVALLSSFLAVADTSGPIDPFPITGNYQAFFREDREGITVIDFAGNYDRNLPNGAGNYEPRAVIAREFFRTHPDEYDFIVAFSTFEFATGEALAFHLQVQNRVQGIGLQQFDRSALFGSQGKLQGYTDMAALSRYVLDPMDPEFELVLRTLAHETLHQWAAFVRFRNPEGTLNDALLGRDAAHWSYLLDTNGSVEYGARWRDNGDGTFTSVGVRTFFSPLDMYLMGFYRPEEVPPFLLIENPQIDRTQLPRENVTITGTRRTVTVEDIIAAEGPRIPAAGQAQKEFRMAFILLAGPGEQVSDAQIAALNAVRSAFMTRFSIMTGGRAVAHVYPQARPDVNPGTPGVIVGDGPRTAPASVEEALAWLRASQRPAGHWSDKDTTAVRDTTVVAGTMAALDGTFAGTSAAVQWLNLNPSSNTDYIARHARLLSDFGADATPLRSQLLALQNADGGWGIAAGYQSNPLDTALALLAIGGASQSQGALDRAAQYLLTKQNSDGGWSAGPGSPSRTTATTTVLKALQAAGRQSAAATPALAWLVTKQNIDGGFGDSPSTVHDTANVLQAFIAYDSMAQIRGDDATNYILSRQTTSGSWEGSVYTTASAVGALRRFSYPNWVLTSITAAPQAPRDGDRIQFSISVRNDANAVAPASVLRLYDGDPASGGVQVGADLPIPVLAPAASVTFTPTWDSLNGAGAHTFVAVIDPLNEQVEMTKRDNRGSVAVSVQAAPQGADLTFGAPEITVMPAQPNRLPSTLGVSLNVRNLGLTAAENVRVRLWAGAPGSTLAGETALDVLARSTVVVNFTHMITQPGELTFTAELDPDNAIAEANESNNAHATGISTVPSLDLVVTPDDISVDRPTAIVGDDVTFTINLRNEGTSDAPSTQVRYTITDGNSTQELRVNALQLNAGQSAQQTVTWRVDMTGALVFAVQLDRDGLVPELDEANNVATRALDAGSVTGANLAVSFQEFTATPNPALEGYPLALSANVRNTGTQAAQNVEVVFYNGDPAAGGTPIGASQTIATLAPGASETVGVSWPAVVSSADKLLFVVVDPADTIAEFSETDNSAFNLVRVLSLPDFAVAAADIALTPQFPRTGEAVSMTVRIANLGAQGATNVLVRAFDGDPAAGGTPIGGDQSLSSIAGFGVGTVTFNWTAGSTMGSRPLYVQVDPADAVLESNEGNNSAAREVSVQDGDLYAENRYFSPDGDGVRDTTQLSFRLPSSRTVAVEVVGKRSRIVRRFTGPALTDVSGGTVTWDGLDDLGRLVQDGTYEVRVVDAQGAQLGTTIVHVDTNRSSLLEAVGTRFGSLNNLTCELPTVSGLQFSADDSSAFFMVTSGRPPQAVYPIGIYAMAGDGSDIRTLVPESFFGTGVTPRVLSAAKDGSRVGFSLLGGPGSLDRLWVVNSDGKDRRGLNTTSSYNRLITSANGRTIYAVDRTPSGYSLVARATDGSGASRVVYTGYSSAQDEAIELSPDGRTFAVVDRDQATNVHVFSLVDEASGARLRLLEGGQQWARLYELSWAPNSSAVAVLDRSNWRIVVFARDGTLLRTFNAPESRSTDLDARFSMPSWSLSSTEFAFAFDVEPISGGTNPVDLASLDPGGLYVADLITGSLQNVAPFPPIRSDAGPPTSYHVSTWDGREWVKRGELHYGRHYQEQTLDLSAHLPDANGEYRVRIRQRGLDMAHVDSVALLFESRRIDPSAAHSSKSDADVLAQVLRTDHEVIDLHEAEMEVRWSDFPSDAGRIELALNAREARRSENVIPFSYPSKEGAFYEYRVSGVRPLVVDGSQTAQDTLAEPLFRTHSKPDTGHPSADVYGYVQSDAEYLYAALDFTVDNTLEEWERDWASLRIGTADGVKTFRVTSDQNRYGKVGFVRTDKVHHPHRYYEFRIPLKEIGAQQGDLLAIAFQAFGEGGLYPRVERPGPMPGGQLLWVPGERSLIYKNDWYGEQRRDASLWAVHLDEENSQRQLFAESADAWRSLRFSPTGRQLLLEWEAQALNPNSTCYQQGWTDDWSFRSLLNLTADLRAVRSAKAGGIRLRGSAADLNFASYSLEYAPVSDPTAWSPIAPASGQQVVDDLFTTWVPPAPGRYFVRLTAEDLAGNTRRTVKRVSWAETPSITDVYRTPAIISPNGDGVQDASLINYRVLEPVHLTFEIFNEAGARVRAITRSHSTPGFQGNVPWDGRDDNGLLVADGRYRLVVQGYEFYITVDNTPPVVLVSTREAYQPLTTELGKMTLAHNEQGIEWRITDADLVSQELEIGTGADPVAWSSFSWERLGECSLPLLPEPKRPGPWTPRSHPDRTCNVLAMEDFVGRRLRVTATDSAGNRTMATAALPTEQLIVTALGSHERLPCESLVAGQACDNDYRAEGRIEYVPMSRDDGLSSDDESPAYAIDAAAIRFAVAETVRTPIAQLSMQYRLPSQATWNEALLAKFYIKKASPRARAVRLLDAPGITDHLVDAALDLASLQSDQLYVVRLHAIDGNGAHHYSNTTRIRVIRSLTFNGLVEGDERDERLSELLAASPPEEGAVTLWGEERIVEPLESLKLIVRSTDDPRYAKPRELGVLAYPSSTFIFQTKDLQSCKAYSGYLEARTERAPDPVSGAMVATTYRTSEKSFSINCMRLRPVVKPVPAESCGAAPTDLIAVTLDVESLDGTPLALLTLSRPLPDGSEDVVFNVNRPRSGSHTYTLDKSTLPEGALEFTARLINRNDDEISQRVEIIIDHTPPTARITYPLEGQRVCGVVRQFPDGTTRNEVTLEGEAVDANGVHYAVEYFSDAGVSIGTHDSRDYEYDPALGYFARTSRQRDFHLRPGRAGPIDQFFGRSGEVRARLSVEDWGGFKQCVDRSFYVDANVENVRTSIDRALFSPNGDGQLDQVSVTYEIDEAATLNVNVYRAQIDARGQWVIIGDSIRTLMQQAAVLPGASSVEWDGLTGAGTVAEDGRYGIVLAFRDACGNEVTRREFTQLDNTPPDVVVVYPRTTDQLPMVVEVQGSVGDLHPHGFSVDLGVGSFPETWARLLSKVGETRRDGNGLLVPEVLALWNTFGLSGEHVVRVVATDRVANQRIVEVPVNLTARTNLISQLEAQPELFSPNADGRLDSTAIRFALEQPALVNLTLQDASGGTRRTLLNQQSLQPGPRSQTWDGTEGSGAPLPDGTYTAVLRATLASDPLVSQEESVTVILDRTPPLITVTRPTGGFVPALGGIIGTIRDDRLREYEVALTDSPQAPSWEMLETGEVNRIDAVLGSLEEREEGEYALRITARDQGEITASSVVPFVIDNTAPKVELTAPAAGTVAGIRKGPVNVAGTVEERYLQSYQLRAGNGAAPSSWTELASGTTLPLPPVLRAWDVSTQADGLYTLQLLAQDRAGHTAEKRLAVVVDNTPPTVSLSTPTQLGYVTQPFEVRGSANDANFAEYTLQTAPGSSGTASRWSEVATGGQPVDENVLASWEALPPDGVYTLRLSARDQADNTAETRVEVTVDTKPPLALLELRAQIEGRTGARLDWRASTEPDLAGYAVHRDGVRITATLLTTPTYLDTGLGEARYVYTVTAFDRAGWESERSNEAQIAIDVTPPVTRISTPAAGTTVGGLLDIIGTAHSTDDFKEYRLSVGPGAAPTDFQLLRRSPVPVLGDVLAAWNTVVLAEGAQFTLRLEAEDINGNVGTDLATVTIDNLPPAAPTGLVATPSGSNVQLGWNPNVETDLLGYLIFRNERLANQQGVVVGSLKPFAIAGTAYLDLSLADGGYTYYLLAIDRAGNMSDPSAAVSVTLDNRVPRATIVQPTTGVMFDTPLYVLATTPDTDIARVQFQYRADASATWVDLGAADTSQAYEATFNPTALSLTFGVYHLRAVATDLGSRTDAAPPSISVTYQDATRPATTLGVSAQVNGGDVSLSWTANTDADLRGYHVERTGSAGSTVRLTSTPITGTSYVDPGLADGDYRYVVIALDTTDNEADPSASVPALVYTPSLTQPFTPTAATTITVSGSGRTAANVTGEIVSDAGTIALPVTPTGEEHRFALSALPLNPGVNTLTLRLTDAQGNISKPASIAVARGARPSRPTGVGATASGYNTTVSWNANPEGDIIGYRVFRAEPAVLPDLPMTDLVASASSQLNSGTPPSAAVDSNISNYWAPLVTVAQPLSGQWLAVSWPVPRVVTAINIEWFSFGYAARAFDIEALSGSRWVTVATVRAGNALTETPLDQPYRTTQLRVVLREAGDFGSVRVRRVEVLHRQLVTATQLQDVASDGVHRYTVTALNGYGFESDPSDPAEVGVGDVEPPAPVVLSASVNLSDVSLSWTASTSPDVQTYSVYRDGASIGSVLSPGYVDAGLRNGTYTYTVTAIDAVGNASAPSNPAPATVAIAPLGTAPVLGITQVSSGGALDLSWSAVVDPRVRGYSVQRSLTAGGPYTEVATTSLTQLRDSPLVNGTTYYYVVAAYDEPGNRGAMSNEAGATPQDQLAPVVRIHAPTVPGRIWSTSNVGVNVVARTEPGATVSLFRDGRRIATGRTISAPLTVTTNIDSEYSPQLSRDGRYLLYQSNQGEIRLRDLLNESDLLLRRLGDGGMFANASWSSDGSEVIFREYDEQTGNDYLRAYRVADGVLRNVTNPANEHVGWFTYSADLDRLMVGNQSAAWEYDLASGDRRLLFEDDFWNGSVTWSPDGSRLAYVRRTSQSIVIVHIPTLAATVIGTAADSAVPVWAPDGSALAFASGEIGDVQIRRYILQSGDTATLTAGPGGHFDPQWAPDGAALAYVDSGGVVILDLATGTSSRLADPGVDLWLAGWSSAGYLLLSREYLWTRMTLPGRVEFGVTLSRGENLIAMSAVDIAGNAGALSAPIVIVQGSDLAPDLVVTDADLRIVPAAPLVGETARVTVTVRNEGTAPSGIADLSLVVIDPTGVATTLIDGPSLNPIPVGGRQTVSFDWSAAAPAGRHTLFAVADPLNRIAERSEANNLAVRAFDVISEGGQQLSVQTDRTTYDAGDQVMASVALRNYTQAFSGSVEILVEDSQGYLVQNLATVQVPGMQYGAERIESAAWQTGSTFAGPYQIHARVLNASGQLVAEARAPFVLRPNSQFVAAVVTDRLIYLANSGVRASGSYSYTAGNAPVAGAEATLRIIDAADVVLAETRQPLGELLPGTTGTITLDWNTGTQPVGAYRATLSIGRSEEMLASAQSVLRVESGSADLSGSMTLSEQAPAPGVAQVVSFSVRNLGNSSFSQLPVLVSLLGPGSATPIDTRQITGDLSVGGELTGTVSFDTAALLMQTYTVSLQAQVPDGSGTRLVTLQTLGFAIADRSPPVVSIRQPVADALLRSGTNALIFARDQLTVVAGVEISVDEGAWRTAQIHSESESLYASVLAELIDGVHTIRARATDRIGNEAVTPSVTFVVDNTAPQIEVLGAVEGGRYPGDVTLSITVQDANLASTDITLNGVPYVSGTPITSSGQQHLVAVAVDAAGNRTSVELRFVIDRSAPVITVTGVEEGGLYNADVTPVIVVTDADPTTYTATLNGTPYASGTVVTAEGAYTLAVEASDTTGNTASLTLQFAIDRTAPALSITQPVEGATLSTLATDVAGTTEPLADVFLTVGTYQATGTADASGSFNFTQVPLAEGANLIQAYARDRAGNNGPAASTNVTVTTNTAVTLQGAVVHHHGVLVWLPGNSETSGMRVEGIRGVRTPGSSPPVSGDRYGSLSGLLEQTFAAQAVDYRIVRNEYDFIDALRSRRYDQMVFAELPTGGVSGVAQLSMSTDTMREIRAMASAGMGVVWIKAWHNNNANHEHLFGARSAAALTGLTQVTLPDGAASVAGTHSVANGRGVRLTLIGGTRVGDLSPGGDAAMSIHQLGDGRTALMAFDPTAFASQTAAVSTLVNVLLYTRPVSLPVIPGGVVELSWTASQIEPLANPQLRVPTLPNGMRLLTVYGGTVTPEGEAAWDLGEDVSAATVSALVRLPIQDGTYAVQARLYERPASQPANLIVQETLQVAAETSRGEFALEVKAELDNLVVPGSQATKLNQARAYFEDARTHAVADIDGIWEAIQFLTIAYENLHQIAPRPHPAMSSVGRLMLHYQALYDYRSPWIWITGVADGGTYNSDITVFVQVGDADPLTSIIIRLNGQPFVSGTTLSAEGAYELYAEATDSYGSTSSQTLRFTIDKTAPTVLISQPVDGSTRTSYSTNVSGSTQAFADVFLTAGTFQVNGTADANGLFHFTHVPLEAGENRIEVYARDPAGNTGPAAAVTVTVSGVTAEQLQGEVVAHHAALVWLPGNAATQDQSIEGYKGVRTAGSSVPPAGDRYAPLISLLEATFASRQLDYRIVRNELAFLEALRSGRYDMTMFAELASGGDPDSPASLSMAADTLKELVALASGGMGVLWIKTFHQDPEPNALLLRNLFGAGTAALPSQRTQLLLPASAASVPGTWDLSGAGVDLSVAWGGTAVGTLMPGSTPAMSIYQVGNGRTAMLGFNPADMADPQGAIDTLSNVLTFVTPTTASPVPGGVVEVMWTASQLITGSDMELQVPQLPAGVTFITAYGGNLTGATQAQWTRGNVAGTSLTFSALLRLPPEGTSYSIGANLYRVESGSPGLVRQAAVAIDTPLTLDSHGAQVTAALNALTVPPGDQDALDHARYYLGLALAEPRQRREDVAGSIRYLVLAYWAGLREISTPPESEMALLGRQIVYHYALWSSLPP